MDATARPDAPAADITDQSDVPTAIDATNRRFETHFAAGDPAAAAQATYTRDARILPPGMPMMQGREAIADFWRAAATQMGIQRVALATVDLDVQAAHAHEIGRATLTLGDGQEVTAKYVVIWKREDGEWRWDVDIWNMESA